MVALTPQELTIIQDTSFLLAKQEVTKKLIELLTETERQLHQIILDSGFSFPANAFVQSGKISKGENYLGLPYLLLDYPRLFSQQEVWAYRVMVWWGHELSCTLHLAGNCLHHYSPSQFQRLTGESDLYFCVNNSPWEYHFEQQNYMPISALSTDEINAHMQRNDFIKLAFKTPLSHPETFNSFILKNFARFLKYLAPV